MQSFKKELKKAKHFYFNIWRGNEKPCPAFNKEIVKVGQAGWRHIKYSDKRNKKEVIPRLQLLPTAKYILENQVTFRERRKVANYEYWSLEEMVGADRVRVVIRSINKGPKHFFSVFIVKKQKQKAPLSLGPALAGVATSSHLRTSELSDIILAKPSIICNKKGPNRLRSPEERHGYP